MEDEIEDILRSLFDQYNNGSGTGGSGSTLNSQGQGPSSQSQSQSQSHSQSQDQLGDEVSQMKYLRGQYLVMGLPMRA